MSMTRETVEKIVHDVLRKSLSQFDGEIQRIDYDFDRGSWKIALLVEGDRRIAMIPEERLEDNDHRAIAAILCAAVINQP